MRNCNKTVAGVIASVGIVMLPVAAEIASSSAYGMETMFRWSAWSLVSVLPLWCLNFSKVRWGAVDSIAACLALIYGISAAINGRAVSVVAVQELFPLVLMYVCVKVFVSAGEKPAQMFVFLLCCLWLCYEAVIGLQQVFGHRVSGHSTFGMTGNFGNPGPYGGFIAITMSVAAVYIIRHISAAGRIKLLWIPILIASAGTFLGILVLPASMSRAAWLAFAVAMAVFAFSETEIIGKLMQRKLLAVFAIVAVCVMLGIGFFMKKESAIGRMHIWNMEIRVIASSPLIGHGPGTYLGEYGKAQENYFRADERSSTIIEVAGCPEYAFNEYLKTGMETGVSGLIMIVALAVMAIRKLSLSRSPFKYGLIAATVFSFFSYPMSLPQTSFCIVAFIAFAGAMATSNSMNIPINLCVIIACIAGIFLLKDGFRQRAEAMESWKAAKSLMIIGLYDDAAAELGSLYPTMSWNYRYMYDFGYALHKAGKYDKSTEILSEGAANSSDPLFHTIMGKNYETSGQYDKAEQEYMTAHYMLPCRIYPLSLLMDMYALSGRIDSAISVGDRILLMPVNVKNRTMKELQDEVREKQEMYRRQMDCQ